MEYRVVVTPASRGWRVSIAGIGHARCPSLLDVVATATGLVATATTEPLSEVRLYVDVAGPKETTPTMTAMARANDPVLGQDLASSH